MSGFLTKSLTLLSKNLITQIKRKTIITKESEIHFKFYDNSKKKLRKNLRKSKKTLRLKQRKIFEVK